MKKLFITSVFLCLAIILAGAQVCFAPPGTPEQYACFDGFDNDLDGLTDCADPDCNNETESELCDTGLLGQCRWGIYKCISGAKKCIGNSPVSEVCDSMSDWDCDGFVGVADPDCAVPICDANGPYTAECSGSIALDATGSSDPSGSPLTYSWSTDCPGGSFNDATSAMPTLTLNSSSTGSCDVTLTATNSSGLSSTCLSTVNVADTTPPDIICPENITQETTTCTGAVVTYTALASDPCGLDIFLFSCSSNSGDVFPVGTTIVTCTSVDPAGNSSSCSFTVTVADTTPPAVTIITPQANFALQDGVIFQAQATDACLDKVFFSVREPDGPEGIPIGYDDLEATFNTATGYWEYAFDTTMLQDGYYVLLAKAIDKAGNEATTLVPFSIRNWAVIVLLPSTPNNKAGRTMPVKFSLRIAASVDPAMPFVYNEYLEIRIYRCLNPSCILKMLMQTSTYGTGTTSYRINGELYITNFKTARLPAQYLVEIWRPSNNFMVGSFTFRTVK